MATVLHRITKQFKRSVHGPAFPVVDWIHNPDMSAVEGQPVKYWVIAGDSVNLLEPQAARDAVDAAEAQAAIDRDRASEKARMDTERSLKAFAKIFADEINILRVNAGMAPRTIAQVRAAYKAAVDVV